MIDGGPIEATEVIEPYGTDTSMYDDGTSESMPYSVESNLGDGTMPQSIQPIQQPELIGPSGYDELDF